MWGGNNMNDIKNKQWIDCLIDFINYRTWEKVENTSLKQKCPFCFCSLMWLTLLFDKKKWVVGYNILGNGNIVMYLVVLNLSPFSWIHLCYNCTFYLLNICSTSHEFCFILAFLTGSEFQKPPLTSASLITVVSPRKVTSSTNPGFLPWKRRRRVANTKVRRFAPLFRLRKDRQCRKM